MVQKTKITFESLPDAVAEVLRELKELKETLKESSTKEEKEPLNNPFEDYIPREEIYNKYVNRTTLWNWENQGKITAYGIGGKRYYKRADVEALFVELKK